MSEKNKNKEEKEYFADVKKGDEIFGLVFGHGVVDAVWGDGHYTFEVEFDNGSMIAYTPEGYPSWAGGKLDFQTIYYKNDIDAFDFDIAPNDTSVLTPKKIIKLRNKKKLEMRCPSGIWCPQDKIPGFLMEENLENGLFHLFRKAEGNK